MNEAIFGVTILATLKVYNSGSEAFYTGLVGGLFMALILVVVNIIKFITKKIKKKFQKTELKSPNTVKKSMKYCPRCGREYDSETYTYCKDDGTFLKSSQSSDESLNNPKKPKVINKSPIADTSNHRSSFGLGNRTASPYIILGITMVIIFIIIAIASN